MFPSEWVTFEGNHVKSTEIDQQHLSNSYWYSRIILGRSHEEIKDVQELFDSRFNGLILPYRPKPEFEFEIHCLRDYNMLKKRLENSERIEWNIVWKGITIGELIQLKEKIYGAY